MQTIRCDVHTYSCMDRQMKTRQTQKAILMQKIPYKHVNLCCFFFLTTNMHNIQHAFLIQILLTTCYIKTSTSSTQTMQCTDIRLRDVSAVCRPYTYIYYTAVTYLYLGIIRRPVYM